jgi:hypothetical protein
MHKGRYEILFLEHVVMTMDLLKLETGQPRESVLRDLKGIGYYSSYNARGKFYTLSSTPKFDELGLWKYRNAFFSSKRTLLDTAEYLVGASSAGYTHDELRQILGIQIQNSLYQLTIEGRIVRQQTRGQYVYFGKECIGNQLEKRAAVPYQPIMRKAAKTSAAKCHPDMDPLLVIDILVAVLRGYDTDSTAHGYLNRTGSSVTAEQVAAVFCFYDIGKKNSTIQN